MTLVAYTFYFAAIERGKIWLKQQPGSDLNARYRGSLSTSESCKT
jgi:hypothetical protein